MASNGESRQNNQQESDHDHLRETQGDNGGCHPPSNQPGDDNSHHDTDLWKNEDFCQQSGASKGTPHGNTSAGNSEECGVDPFLKMDGLLYNETTKRMNQQSENPTCEASTGSGHTDTPHDPGQQASEKKNTEKTPDRQICENAEHPTMESIHEPVERSNLPGQDAITQDHTQSNSANKKIVEAEYSHTTSRVTEQGGNMTDETLKWKEKINELESELLRKEELLKQEQNYHKKHDEKLSQQLATQLEKNQDLQDRLHTNTQKFEETERKLNAKVSTQMHDLKQLHTRNANLQIGLDKANENVAGLQKHNQNLADEIRKAKKELQGTVDHHQVQDDKQKSQIKSHREEIKSLKQEQNQLMEQIKALQKDLEKQRRLAEKWQSEKMKADNRYKEMETKFVHAAKRQNSIVEGVRKEAKELQKQLNEKTDKIRELETWVMRETQMLVEIEDWKKEVTSQRDQLLEKQKDMKDLQEENARLSNSLSKEWSTKVSSDESNTENISMTNRPMTLKSEYENICSNEWLDAKTDLDELGYMGEKDRRMLLCEIPVNAEICAQKHHQAMMTNLKRYLTQPLTHTVVSVAEQAECGNEVDQENSDSFTDSNNTSHTSKSPAPSSDFPMELQNALGDYMRIFAKSTDMTMIVQDLNKQLAREKEKDAGIGNIFKKESLQKYISVCSLLAWKMITQRPQMTFKMEGLLVKYDEKTQEPNYGSEDPYHRDAVVMYYVTPALYHANNIMVKGKVVTEILN